MNKHKLYTSLFLALILFTFILKLYSLFIKSDLMWDASVYIGMGKYIYSGGKYGLWEPSRPLVWPLITGFFWKIGIDYIFWAKFITILFSMGCIVLVYILSKGIFDYRTGFYAALFFAVSPEFFILGNVPLSDIPSAFFLLLGAWFFIRRMHKHTGFFLGLSFMTRFFQIFSLIPILLVYAFLLMRKKIKHSDFLKFALFFFIPVLLFILTNLYLYKDIFYPFAMQAFMTKNTGFAFNQPFGYYLINLFKENYLALFGLVGIALILKQGSPNRTLALLMFFVPFAVYNFADHKEMRFMISVLPFLFMLASFGFLHIADLFKKNKEIFILILVAVFMIQTYPQLEFYRHNGNFDLFYNYINTAKQNSGIWISNPSFIANSDKKADELVYYPLYGSGKAKELQNKVPQANLAMLNTCDILPCMPEDKACSEETLRLIKTLKEELRLVRSSNFGSCDYFIFER